MRFSSVSQWLAWQETLNPKEIDLGLERVKLVAQRLQLLNPAFKVITVAGTNGKGSCVALLSAMLTAAGYHTGAYTSPHLLRYQERIRVDEADIDDETLCRAFQRVDDARAEVPLTYFEFGTLTALLIFKDAGVDVTILEVGLGGRLDAVNVLDADVALITSIDIDHCDWLGNDREQIGREKAGIMRSGRPLVCGDLQPPSIIESMAASLGVSVDRIGREFQYQVGLDCWSWSGRVQHYQGLPKPLLAGAHQYQNAAACLAVLERLVVDLHVSREHIEAGMRSQRLPGRFQRIARAPDVIVDIAHNPQAANSLAKTLATQVFHGRTHAVFSALADKDIVGVISALQARIDFWYIAPLTLKRASSLEQLEQAIRSAGITQYQSFSDVAAAYHAAFDAAGDQDRLLVFGSFHTVAAVLELADDSSV